MVRFLGDCFTAIIGPDGRIIGEPITEGEGSVIDDLDFGLIDARKRLMDARGHYSRPELLSLLIDHRPAPQRHERAASGDEGFFAETGSGFVSPCIHRRS